MKKTLLLALSIFFASLANAQLITGANMDTWLSYTSSSLTMSRPTGWISTDSLTRAHFVLLGLPTYEARITQSTTVKHSGTSAARLVANSTTDSIPVILANSDVSFNIADFVAGNYKFTYTGGTPVSARYIKVNAYVYLPSGPDTALMFVNAYKNGIAVGGGDSLVGTGSYEILPNSAFTKISTTIAYVNSTIVPDRLVVGFAANKSLKIPKNDTLYVDDVTIEPLLSIHTPINNIAKIVAYPNPAMSTLHISTSLSQEIEVVFYNNLGQKIMSQKMTNQADINVSRLTVGTYTYTVADAATGQLFYSSQFARQ